MAVSGTRAHDQQCWHQAAGSTRASGHRRCRQPLNRPSRKQPPFLPAAGFHPPGIPRGRSCCHLLLRCKPPYGLVACMRPPPARRPQRAALLVQLHAPRALCITCKRLGLFQGRQPLAPPVVTPSVEPCAASRCLPAMAQLTITARMTVPQVRPGGAKGWAGPPPPGRRRRAHAPPASSRSASLSLPLQPALRRARVYWDLGERPSRCWSAAAPQRRSAPPARLCFLCFCGSNAPSLPPQRLTRLHTPTCRQPGRPRLGARAGDGPPPAAHSAAPYRSA